MKHLTYGRHVIADIWGVNFNLIDDINFLIEHMDKAAKKCGANVLSISHKKFQPYGATVLVLLSESHLSIHTYPEEGFAAIDGYTCGTNIDPQVAIDYLLEQFKPKNVYTMKIMRGSEKVGLLKSENKSESSYT